MGRAGNGKLGVASKPEKHAPCPGCVAEIHVRWILIPSSISTNRENLEMESLKSVGQDAQNETRAGYLLYMYYIIVYRPPQLEVFLR